MRKLPKAEGLFDDMIAVLFSQIGSQRAGGVQCHQGWSVVGESDRVTLELRRWTAVVGGVLQAPMCW